MGFSSVFPSVKAFSVLVGATGLEPVALAYIKAFVAPIDTFLTHFF